MQLWIPFLRSIIRFSSMEHNINPFYTPGLILYPLNNCVNVSWKSYILSQDRNPFHATDLFLYPLKTLGNLWFLGGIERDQWHEMG